MLALFLRPAALLLWLSATLCAWWVPSGPAIGTPLEDYLGDAPSTNAFPVLPRPTFPETELDGHLTAAENLFANADKLGAVLELEAAARLAPKNPLLRVALGELYLQIGLPEQALEAANAALAVVPDAAQPYDIIGAAERALGQSDEAAKAFRTVIERAPDQAIGYLHLAETEIAHSNYAAALVPAEQAVSRDPNSVRALLIVVDCELHLGHLDAAVKRAETLLRIEPGNAYAYFLRGDARLALGLKQDAEADYRAAVQHASDPTHFELRLAELLATEGRTEEAIAIDAAILKRNPENREAHSALAIFYAGRGQRARAEFHRGILALLAGDLKAAANHLENATNTDRRLKDAWLARAAVALRQGDAKGADTVLRPALALAPNDPAILTLRGRVALARGDRVFAERALRAAIAADRRYSPALMELAQMKRLKGDCAGALPLYRAASESAPAAAEPYKGIGACQEALGRLAEAETAFRAAIARAPQDARAVNALAWVELMQRDKLPAALLSAKRASLLLPGDPEIIDTLGWAYFLNGRPDLAVPNLQTALDGLANEPTVHYHLGMALAAVGRNTEATAELKAALHAGTNFPEEAEARRELDHLGEQKPN